MLPSKNISMGSELRVLKAESRDTTYITANLGEINRPILRTCVCFRGELNGGYVKPRIADVFCL